MICVKKKSTHDVIKTLEEHQNKGQTKIFPPSIRPNKLTKSIEDIDRISINILDQEYMQYKKSMFKLCTEQPFWNKFCFSLS